jgi:hypothetical protein
MKRMFGRAAGLGKAAARTAPAAVRIRAIPFMAPTSGFCASAFRLPEVGPVFNAVGRPTLLPVGTKSA